MKTETNYKLFMVLLGGKPKGRHIEQHDIYFGIGEKLNDLVPQFLKFWPETNGKIHIDVWREVNFVNNYQIEIFEKTENFKTQSNTGLNLFFLNLGGYRKNEFEEFHYKILLAAKDYKEAILESKKTGFFKDYGFEKATAHIDDKYGIDVDDIYNVRDILPEHLKEKFEISIKETSNPQNDILHIGYLKLKS